MLASFLRAFLVVLVNGHFGKTLLLFIISLELVRDLLTSWADNQYSSGMLQEALTSGCLGPTGKLGKNIAFIRYIEFNRGKLFISLKNLSRKKN